MSLKKALLALSCGLFLSFSAHAEILFEGFYRIEKEGRHTGYLIHRVSTDQKGNRVSSTYIRSRMPNDREVYTTVKATAKAGKGEPVETVHVSNSSGLPYKIWGQFKNGSGSVSFHSNNNAKPGLVQKISVLKTPSAFLYLQADIPKFSPGKKYFYTSFYEENGRNEAGQLSILGAKESAGKKFLQILNDDSGQPIETFVAENGDSLGSRSVSTGSTCFWVATKEEAVSDMTYPTGEMTALFGDLPQGKKNQWLNLPGFQSIKVIEGFTLWDGSRATSSSPAGEVLPMPMRGI